MLGGFQKAIKFSSEKVGKPERELKRDLYDARRENTLLGKDSVANWIWQIIDLSKFGLFDFDPSGFDPARQDSAVLVVSRRHDLSSKRSNPRAAKQVRSVFLLRLHSAKYRRE